MLKICKFFAKYNKNILKIKCKFNFCFVINIILFLANTRIIIMEENKINFLKELDSSFDEENQIGKMYFSFGNENFAVYYIESLIDKKLFASSIIAQIEKVKTSCENKNNKDKSSCKNNNKIFEKIKNALTVSSVSEVTDIAEIKNNIFSGSAVIVFKDKALACLIYGVEKRSIAEPPSAKVIKGPREGFVEDIYTNTGLTRKRIKSSDLKIKNVYVGERSKTLISVFYMDKVAKPNVIESVMNVLQSIDIDAIIDSYYIQSYLEGNKLKFFKRVGSTEKPDVFSAKILEGRVGILVDGSPIALTVPFMLLEDLQSASDYYSIPAVASFTRVMRFFGLIIALLLPGVYVSLQSYNYRILPINFLITLLSSIEGLSIPPLLEILLVLFLFEIISEASVRMPSALGMALSIIGALALGNTAVDAGIISPPSIVIVAISSVALHIIPDEYDEARLLRILFTTIGGIIGLYGMFVCVFYLITYLCAIESFGVPYLTPYSPTIDEDKKDGFIMKPIQEMKSRPILISGEDKIRQGDFSDKKSRDDQERKLSKKNREDKQKTKRENDETKNEKIKKLQNLLKKSEKPINTAKISKKSKLMEEKQWVQDNFILFYLHL